ncbi:preprotein translocase subunit SecY [Granulicella aggregans]|uniref:Preprotein translocase subunit SecY n=1 Tax=Granulicella aggregans TaxID=474949 RepID=A0A7W7ZB55_9BACT|nr:preprotein translocase subunit SecY [Granulicella aggregans]
MGTRSNGRPSRCLFCCPMRPKTESMASMIKRIFMWLAVIACLYLGSVLVLLPLLEHILGIGVYQKGTGVYRK